MDKLNIIHDSHSIQYRNPFGAIRLGTIVNIKIASNIRCSAYINVINFYNNKIENQMEEVGFDNEKMVWFYEYYLDTKDLFGLNYYYFRIQTGQEHCFYGNNYYTLGGIGQIYNDEPKLFQITVHTVDDIPAWYKEGVIYQIFVDRFYNGNEEGKILNTRANTFIYGNWYDKPMYIKSINGDIARWDFYGGNLLGVKKKLEYIKSLGANIIYLNPIFESPSCHKYDTADYENIDRMFGDNNLFEELCNDADRMGIKIILDGVFSHTGAESRYFNKYNTYKEIGAYQSLQSDYYRWYKFQDYPNSYESWWGISNMPEVDELNSSYLDYIIRSENSIISKWLKLGASGWRLDVADELPDEFIKLLKAKLKEVKPDGILVGEVWEDASNKISYDKKREYVFGKELDSITNYPVRNLLIQYVNKNISAEMFIKKYMSLMENYPEEIFYSSMNMLGNHDTERILTMVNRNKDLLELLMVMQMTLPGVPLIYYGDEVGLVGGKDPDNRRTYPWGKEDNKILDKYKQLITLRKSESALIGGKIKFRDFNNNILCYERYCENNTILVIINGNDRECIYKIIDETEKYEVLLEDNNIVSSAKENIEVNLKCNGYIILKNI